MSMQAAVAKLFSAVITQSGNVQEDIETATTAEDGAEIELKQEDILVLQYKIGQFNALMEAASSISKGTTDMLKTLAQRTS